jgi:DNA (cytosine-5)-methyltransferase 1
VISPEKGKIRQNGRRFKEDGEDAFAVTAQDRHGLILREVSGIYTNTSDNFWRRPLREESRTLKAGKHDAGVIDGYRIRRLTPRETWRLQGFPDWAFEKAAAVNGDNQLYKQAGNSVTVPVIYEIAKRLAEIEKEWG